MNTTKPTSVTSFIETYIHNQDQRKDDGHKIGKFIKNYNLKDVADLSAAFEIDWDPYETDSEFKQIEALNVPKWFAKQISQGHIDAFFIYLLFTKETFFDCQVEDFDQPSSYTCSRKLRQLMYSIMFKDIESEQIVISEYDRSLKKEGKRQIVKNHVPVQSNINYMNIPSLSEVTELKDKCQFFFDALRLNSTLQFNPNVQLALIVITYWKANSELGINELHTGAILLCMIKLALDREENMSGKQAGILGYPVIDHQNMFRIRKRLFFLTEHERHASREWDMGIIHVFAEFQAVLRDIMYFIELLQYPFKPVCPSRVFNGFFLYNAYCELQCPGDPKKYMCELLGNLSQDLKTLLHFLDLRADQNNDYTWQKVRHKSRGVRKQYNSK